jgi:hypothetical protein
LQHSTLLQGHIERAIENTVARGVDLGLNASNVNAKAVRDDEEDDGSDEEDTNENDNNLNTDSAASIESVTADMQSPLRREEIGKLLLLISRAYSTRQIDHQQRRLIKSHVCRRAGYLRILLLQTDMSVVMAALSAIGKEGGSGHVGNRRSMRDDEDKFEA